MVNNAISALRVDAGAAIAPQPNGYTESERERILRAYHERSRACQNFCVRGHHNVSGILSAKRIAKRFNAALHSLIGIVHFSVMFCNAR